MERILTQTTDYLCLSEEEAIKLVETKRAEGDIAKYNVTHKAATKKKEEYWLVSIKQRINLAEDFVAIYEG